MPCRETSSGTVCCQTPLFLTPPPYKRERSDLAVLPPNPIIHTITRIQRTAAAYAMAHSTGYIGGCPAVYVHTQSLRLRLAPRVHVAGSVLIAGLVVSRGYDLLHSKAASASRPF